VLSVRSAEKEFSRPALSDTIISVGTNKFVTLPTEPMLGNAYGIRLKKKREKLDKNPQNVVIASPEMQRAIAQLGERLHGIQGYLNIFSLKKQQVNICCFGFNLMWGISSAGRARRWQRRGQRFDPAILHQKTVQRCPTPFINPQGASLSGFFVVQQCLQTSWPSWTRVFLKLCGLQYGRPVVTKTSRNMVRTIIARSKWLSGTAHGRYSRGHYTKDTIANQKEIMALYRTAQRGGLEIADIYGIQSNILRCSKMQDYYVSVVHHEEKACLNLIQQEGY
jgi:hypothetical protein